MLHLVAALRRNSSLTRLRYEVMPCVWLKASGLTVLGRTGAPDRLTGIVDLPSTSSERVKEHIDRLFTEGARTRELRALGDRWPRGWDACSARWTDAASAAAGASPTRVSGAGVQRGEVDVAAVTSQREEELEERLEAVKRQKEMLEEVVLGVMREAKGAEAAQDQSRKFAEWTKQIARQCEAGSKKALEAMAEEADAAADAADAAEEAAVKAEASAGAAQEAEKGAMREARRAEEVVFGASKEIKATAEAEKAALLDLVSQLKAEVMAERGRSALVERQEEVNTVQLRDATERVGRAMRYRLDEAVELQWGADDGVSFRPDCTVPMLAGPPVSGEVGRPTAENRIAAANHSVHAGLWQELPAVLKVISEVAKDVDGDAAKVYLREFFTHKKVAAHHHVVDLYGITRNPPDQPFAVVMGESGAVMVRPSWLLRLLAGREGAGLNRVRALAKIMAPSFAGGAASDLGVAHDGSVTPPPGLTLLSLAERSLVVGSESVADHDEIRSGTRVVRSLQHLLSALCEEASHAWTELAAFPEGATGVANPEFPPEVAAVASQSVEGMAWALLPLQRRLLLAIGAARGLAHLHSLSIAHRDVKPENLLVGNSASGWIVRVADFGDARVTMECTLNANPQAPQHHGTPPYMAPEAWAPDDSTEPSVKLAGDVYSFGCVLYMLLRLGAQDPWDPQVPRSSSLDERCQQLRQKVVSKSRPSISSLSDGRKFRGTLPGPWPSTKLAGEEEEPTPVQELLGLIKKCWKSKPGDRPSMRAVLQRLEALEKRTADLDMQGTGVSRLRW